jgi:hypothetical protein
LPRMPLIVQITTCAILGVVFTIFAQGAVSQLK